MDDQWGIDYGHDTDDSSRFCNFPLAYTEHLMTIPTIFNGASDGLTVLSFANNGFSRRSFQNYNTSILCTRPCAYYSVGLI